jgi:hypothetical protein
MTAVTDQIPQETAPKPRGSGQIVALGLILLVVGGLLVAWMMVSFMLPGRLDFHSGTTVAAGNLLQVDAPDANINLVPGPDGSVRVLADGHYVSVPPTVSVKTTGQTTMVSASCPDHGDCDLQVTISVPVALNAQVDAVTGHVEADGLRGTLNLSSVDGSVDVRGSTGAVTIRAVNGSIDLDGSRSPRVDAQGENGSVKLNFLEPPTNVTATSTNGSVSVRAPQPVVAPFAYRVLAQSEHGGAKVSVAVDDSSTQVITATSTNGSVKVFS